MPFTASAAFKAHLSSGSTTLALLLRLVRSDGQVFAMTNHVENISMGAVTINGITVPAATYRADAGMLPTNLVSSEDLKPDNFEVEGFLTADFLTDSAVRAGLFAGATWTLLLVNYADLTQSLLRGRGTVGKARISGPKVVFELKSLSQAFSLEILEKTGPLCRYPALGEGGCPFNLAGNTLDGFAARVATTVSTVASRRQMTFSAISGYPAKRFYLGRIAFTSGANAGLAREVIEHTGTTLKTRLEFPFDIAPGDSATLTVGDDFRFATCSSVFGVAFAFNGEPDVPTIEEVQEVENE